MYNTKLKKMYYLFFGGAIYMGCEFLAYLQRCNFVDASVFSFTGNTKNTKSCIIGFVKKFILWAKAIHEYYLF